MSLTFIVEHIQQQPLNKNETRDEINDTGEHNLAHDHIMAVVVAVEEEDENDDDVDDEPLSFCVDVNDDEVAVVVVCFFMTWDINIINARR